uniref:Uncharacterized protein n=1 Tax=Populus trichocarpa TaxID=3694 RepID=A0A2K2CCH5_POPTR
MQFGHQVKHLPFFPISFSKGFAPSISLFASSSHFLTPFLISLAFLSAASTSFCRPSSAKARFSFRSLNSSTKLLKQNM